MKRNEYGINFDEGLPFESDWEFKNLYVPFHKNQIEEFTDWIKNSNTPILIGGQIGSGKSTFITKAFKDCNTNPDIRFQFDTEGNNLSQGDFLKILLIEIAKYALLQKLDLSFSKLPDELTEKRVTKWETLIEQLSSLDFSLESFTFKKDFAEKLAANNEFVISIISRIIEEIEKKIPRKLILFASGIDKYEPLSAGFFSLSTSLDLLSKYKTIFEVNAVHLFNNKWNLKTAQKIFLGTFEDEQILELLRKRKGIYFNSTENIIKNLSKLSGGNPRQALRLLMNFEHFKNKKQTQEDSLHFSVKKTIQDFFAFSDEPSKELMKYVEKEKSLSATLLTLIRDEDTAQKAVYGNWIYIIDKKEGNVWNARVNPIVSLFFNDEISPEDHDILLLKKYAEEKQLNPSGMTFQVINNENWISNVKQELIQSGTENFKLNLTDTLDLLTSSLLSNKRQDRIIIAYKSKDIMEVTKAYVFSKVFSFDSPTIIDYKLNNSENLVFQVNKILSKNKVSIYSFVFEKDFPDDQITEVDKIRDKLLNNQILWWIPLEYLYKYLQKWTQLRQLFQIIILENEIMNVLNVQQIEEDIEFSSKIKGSDSLILKNLKLVLEYLKTQGGHK
jgi:hypothetical protein